MQITNIIEEKNLKLTSARKELLEILDREKKPISFEDIKHKINMDKATFYRNISKFESNSIVNSFESNDKKRYYEIQGSPHSHFICNTCNHIECLESILPTKLEGYSVSDVIYKGICKSCKEINLENIIITK
ncbi:Fur family transcriptional regulator [Sulfurimonas sp.]|uniref:Fur family transcriptional regulator n=1 Tax=Sulfurimonas sp. TaxID=2022749 RepID=UPI002B4A0562|nr:transcriptional repressor [Sulfurimonas sp.]